MGGIKFGVLEGMVTASTDVCLGSQAPGDKLILSSFHDSIHSQDPTFQ